jgi:hypothetical protein
MFQIRDVLHLEEKHLQSINLADFCQQNQQRLNKEIHK